MRAIPFPLQSPCRSSCMGPALSGKLLHCPVPYLASLLNLMVPFTFEIIFQSSKYEVNYTESTQADCNLPWKQICSWLTLVAHLFLAPISLSFFSFENVPQTNENYAKNKRMREMACITYRKIEILTLHL